MKARYKSCRYKGKRMRLHVAIWLEENGEPCLPVGYDVHHKDGNRLNNDIDNLVLVLHSEHCSMHMKERIKSIERDSNGRFKKR